MSSRFDWDEMAWRQVEDDDEGVGRWVLWTYTYPDLWIHSHRLPRCWVLT